MKAEKSMTIFPIKKTLLPLISILSMVMQEYIQLKASVMFLREEIWSEQLIILAELMSKNKYAPE